MPTKLEGVLIGCGSVSANHLHAWGQVPGAEITAAFDLQIEKAKKRAEKFGIPRYFSDVDAALAEISPDFLDIAARPAGRTR